MFDTQTISFNKKNHLLFFILLSLIFSPFQAFAHDTSKASKDNDAEVHEVKTQAGVVSITWHNPKHFRDIKATSGLQSRYQQHFFKIMTKSLNKYASHVLQSGQQLELIVKDVDLAGDVRPTFGATPTDIRVVKSLYPPRIRFHYQVKQDDSILLSGEEKLQNLGFQDGIRVNSHQSFHYETQLLKDWVSRSLKPQLNSL